MATKRRGYSLASVGHAAQVAGFYKAGHLIRAGSQMGIGSEISGGTLAGIAADVGIVLGGLVVAAKMVEVGFNALSKTATELVGAIAQIGGAKGIQSMMVESVSNEKLVNIARMSVDINNRMNKAEMINLVHSLSQDAGTGAFTSGEWLQAIGKIGQISGTQANLTKGELGFLGQMALVSGGDLTGISETYARMKFKNKDLSTSDLQNIMLAGHAIGQTGSFNIAELPQARKLMMQTTQLGGMSPEAKNTMVMALGTLVKPGAGSLENAGVELQSFLNQARKAHIAGKDMGMFKYNTAGEITNINDALARTTSMDFNLLPKNLRERESGSFIRNLRESISQKAGVSVEDNSADARAARKKVLEDFENLSMSMDDFQKEVEQSITPQERFRAAFNKISDNLEEKFLQVLIQLEPVIDSLADRITENKDAIGDYFTQFVGWLTIGVEALPAFISVVGSLASATGKTIAWILSHIPGSQMPGSLEEAQGNVSQAQSVLSTYKDQLAKATTPALKASAEGAVRDAEADLVKAKKNLQLYTDIGRLDPAKLAANAEYETANAKYEADRRKQQMDWEKANAAPHVQKEQLAATHKLISIAESDSIIYKSINKNTMPRPEPLNAPSRSPDGT